MRMWRSSGWLMACAAAVFVVAANGAQLRLVRETVRPPDAKLLAEWKPVLSHTHNLRSGEIPFEEAKGKLVDWSRRMGIAAVGVGSPWEPVSQAQYRRYEGPDRDLYYSGKMNAATVMNRAEIEAAISDLNRLSAGSTLFYLDNETPKGRLGHAWWFGYHYDAPAWHDYSQDRPIEYWEGDAERELNALTGQPHRRRPLLEIMAVQRQAGALGVFAHPTSWWLDGDRFITNIASEIPLFLHADGRLDGIVVMGYDALHRPYQRLWFHLLDTGAVVPGFAEVDTFLDSKKVLASDTAYLNFLRIPGAVSMRSIVAAARRGESFMSTGAFLRVSVDGAPMGGIARTSRNQTHRLLVEAYPRRGQSSFSRVEIIGKGGRVLAVKERFAGGVLEYELPGADEAGYVVVRAFGQGDNPDAANQKTIRDVAISNPVYLHPAGFRFEPVRTRVRIRVDPDSKWTGGTLEFQDAAGAALESHPVRAGLITAELPANARVQLSKRGLEARRFYIAMENPKVQALLGYLYRGEFRIDHPSAAPGNVPPQAFRVAEMRQALAEFTYTLR